MDAGHMGETRIMVWTFLGKPSLRKIRRWKNIKISLMEIFMNVTDFKLSQQFIIEVEPAFVWWHFTVVACCQCFREPYCLRHQGPKPCWTSIMEMITGFIEVGTLSDGRLWYYQCRFCHQRVYDKSHFAAHPLWSSLVPNSLLSNSYFITLVSYSSENKKLNLLG